MRKTSAKSLCNVCEIVPSSGTCVGCRVRRARGSGIDGERCAVGSCGIDQPRVLRWHAFRDETLPLCANHSALAGRRPLNAADFLAEASAWRLVLRAG